MDSSTAKFQVIFPCQAKQDGDFLSWYYGLISAARKGNCGAAIPSLRIISKIVKGSLARAATIVAHDQAERLDTKKPFKDDKDDEDKDEDDAEESLPLSMLSSRIPAGFITSATLKQQHDLSALLYQWTDRKKDWAMFNKIDNDDAELGTKMLLHVMRKHMSTGSAPVAEWNHRIQREQGENESPEEVWDRIKTAAAALRSAGRNYPTLMMLDALQTALSPSHMHWANELTADNTIEDIDDAVFNKGGFIDMKERGPDSSSEAAYGAVEDERDVKIRTLTAAIESLTAKYKSGAVGAGGTAARFTGTCLYCKKSGHKIFDCRELKKSNADSGEGDVEGCDGDSAFPACFVAMCSNCRDDDYDCSEHAIAGVSV